MDMYNMRRDAMRRTREMRRQNIAAGNADNVQASENSGIPVPDKPETRSETDSNAGRDKGNESGTKGLLSGFFKDGKIDNDKIIIIALIIILAKEGADLKMLIALGYILM